MPRTSSLAEKWIPLTPAVFHILLALCDEERHGYGIMQQILNDTGGRFRMGPGTLYGSIKRMLAAKLITESESRPQPGDDDERRRYYRLTPTGREVVSKEAARLASAVRIARKRRVIRSRSRVRSL
jgi:DNA-binding PadR family transcriptional regulator